MLLALPTHRVRNIVDVIDRPTSCKLRAWSVVVVIVFAADEKGATLQIEIVMM